MQSSPLAQEAHEFNCSLKGKQIVGGEGEGGSFQLGQIWSSPAGNILRVAWCPKGTVATKHTSKRARLGEHSPFQKNKLGTQKKNTGQALPDRVAIVVRKVDVGRLLLAMGTPLHNVAATPRPALASLAFLLLLPVFLLLSFGHGPANWNTWLRNKPYNYSQKAQLIMKVGESFDTSKI